MTAYVAIDPFGWFAAYIYAASDAEAVAEARQVAAENNETMKVHQLDSMRTVATVEV